MPREDLDETYGVIRRGENALGEGMPTAKEAAAACGDGWGHEHDFVHPRVAVGSGVWTERDIQRLRTSGITHVIDRATCARAPTFTQGVSASHAKPQLRKPCLTVRRSRSHTVIV